MWSLDVPVAPDAALARVDAAINRRTKRVLGVLKIENEFIGVVTAEAFEIWERRAHAVHAVGRARLRGRTTRIEMELHVTPRTRILAVLFFVLYAVAVVEFLSLQPAGAVGPADLVVAVIGALVPAAIFLVSVRRQRSDLRTFIEGLYPDARRTPT